LAETAFDWCLSSFVGDTESEFLWFRMHEMGNKMNKIR